MSGFIVNAVAPISSAFSSTLRRVVFWLLDFTFEPRNLLKTVSKNEPHFICNDCLKNSGLCFGGMKQVIDCIQIEIVQLVDQLFGGYVEMVSPVVTTMKRNYSVRFI